MHRNVKHVGGVRGRSISDQPSCETGCCRHVSYGETLHALLAGAALNLWRLLRWRGGGARRDRPGPATAPLRMLAAWQQMLFL